MPLKPLKKKITVIVEKTKTGFSAYSPGYAVATTGRTIIELQKNILEVLNFYFEDEGYQVSKSNIALEFTPCTIFSDAPLCSMR